MTTRLLIIFILIVNLFFTFWYSTQPAWAAWTVSNIIWKDTPKNLVQPPNTQGDNAEDLALTVIAKVIDIALYFAWLIAVIMIIVWWVRYVSYFWSEDAESQAKSLIINALVGLIIIICSALIIENTDRILRFLTWS